MAVASSLKNRIEHRLREVQQEAALVREDVRALRAALENRDALERLPKLKSSKYYAARVLPPTRTDPVREKQPAPPKIAVPATPPQPILSRNVEERRPLEAAPGGKPRPVQGDERFANLFSSSGFLGTAVSGAMDHRIQRNKAIFVLIFVLLALFIVYNLLMY